MIDILEKIRKLRLERNWSEYQLAEKSDLPQSTISSWYRKNQIPTISSLEKICSSFNLTLSQFLIEESTSSKILTEEQQELLDNYSRLSKKQQSVILELVKSI
ncbi:helix-turn-helix transcriptional regulator [Treponema sp. UBA3813]|uniref:helix-turn-helix domain-containing protein n=1 Tax=Treponema sp. UBA3813 TaxID=1947715 RepID=UPI0025E689D7|nr:helix-turn-helix transcriptional regulator [Treponema sp. UBA3813]